MIRKKSRLTPIRFVELRNRHAYWLYQCECGNKKVIQRASVKRGSSLSCGCYKQEVTTKRNETHRGYGNKSRTGQTPDNKGKIRIHKIPNDPKSPFRYVTEQELTKIYWGVIDEGF